MTPAVPSRWGATDRWTGVVVLLTPTARAAIDPVEALLRVKALVASDPVLGDAVTVGLSSPVDECDERDAETVAQTLIGAALEAGLVFAPQVVFGCVVVDGCRETAVESANRLAASSVLSRLPIYFYGVAGEATADESAADQLVAEVVAKTEAIITSFERWPDFVIGEDQLMAQRRAILAGIEELRDPPAGSDDQVAPALTDTEQPAPPIDGVDESRPERRTRREHVDRTHHGTAHGPRLGRATTTGRSTGEPAPWRRVVGRLAEFRRRRPGRRAETESMDLVALAADTVELVYLILVSDQVGVPRATHARRTRVVLDLDQALAAADRVRAEDGTVIHELAVFGAGRRLARHGPLRPAGHLHRRHLPAVPVEHFDLVTCVAAITHAQARHAASLVRRGTRVSGTRVLFLSTAAPLADTSSVDEFEDLCELATVAWIIFGENIDLMSGEFARAGAHVLQEHPDVLGELMARAFTKDGGPDYPGNHRA